MATRSRRAMPYDYWLVLVVAALLAIGLMMVYSTTYELGYRVHGQPTYYFVRQVVWTALGAVVMLLLARLDYQFWRRWSILIMAGALALLGLVLLMGSRRYGAQRTLLASGSVQPSELCKLAVVIYVADWLSSKGERIRQVTYGLIPFAILIGLVAGLIVLQPDLSTAILVVLTAVAMFFIAGADLLQLIISLVFGSAAFAFLIARTPHAHARIISFVESLGDPYGGSFHVRQGLIALARGGIFGQGLGAGQLKMGTLPLAHTDSVFAALGEELGLIGCLTVIGLFALLVYRGFRIALQAPDAFGAVLAAGVTCWLVFQALIHMAVVTATMPFTGIPLPFISVGGSSLVTSLAGVGLLLSVSRGNSKRITKGITKGAKGAKGTKRSTKKRVWQRAHYDLGWRNRWPRISRSRRR